MPKARTMTMAVRRVRMTGCCDARTMSQPEVAVRAMPDAVAMPPSRPPRTVPAEGHQTRRRRRDHLDGGGVCGGEDEVVVGVREQLVAVCDSDDDTALGELGDEGGDVLGALGVEVRGRLVEEQQRLGGEPGAGQGQPLALAGGQAEAVVAAVG